VWMISSCSVNQLLVVDMAASNCWVVDWMASSRSLEVGLVGLGGMGKENESTNDTMFLGYQFKREYA